MQLKLLATDFGLYIYTDSYFKLHKIINFTAMEIMLRLAITINLYYFLL